LGRSWKFCPPKKSGAHVQGAVDPKICRWNATFPTPNAHPAEKTTKSASFGTSCSSRMERVVRRKGGEKKKDAVFYPLTSKRGEKKKKKKKGPLNGEEQESTPSRGPRYRPPA